MPALPWGKAYNAGMVSNDTIAAISSGAGAGWRGIVRLSGERAWELALGRVEGVAHPEGGRGYRGVLKGLGVPAGVLLFQGPRSYTGLDVAELHLPGSPALLRMILEELLAAGARQAAPGEFTAQAFFQGKMDLSAAEGVAATVAASNDQQLRAAARLREGVLYKWTAAMAEKLARLLALVEAGIDFSDEPGVSFISAAQVAEALAQQDAEMHNTLALAVRVDRLDTLPVVVLVGKPNVGKSSLINALTGQERSIVSPTAGTTRDMLSAVLKSPQGDIRLVDVPGEEAADDRAPLDELRTKMMAAREAALLEADLVVQVVDHQENPAQTIAGLPDGPAPRIGVQNKTDLLSAEQREEGEGWPATGKPWGQVSAQTGYHIPRLRDVIVQLAGRREPGGADEMVVNQRHRVILLETKHLLQQAAALVQDEAVFTRHPELLASELRQALDTLGQITGTITPDEILGRIFASFCIGK